MPTISFNTIEHSDVTGMETVRHDYVIFTNSLTGLSCVQYFKDDVFIFIKHGNDAELLIDSLIHEKTTTKKTTPKTARASESEAITADRRRPHLVCGGQVGEIQNDIKNPVQTNIFD